MSDDNMYAEPDIPQFVKLPEPDPSPFARQEGGDHYKGLPIQPAEFFHKNNVPKLEGDVMQYVLRWRSKNGIDDLRKAIHILEMIIEMESE